MDKRKKNYKVIDGATSWLASTYNYFRDFNSDLLLLKSALNNSKGKKRNLVPILKKALHDFLYASRSGNKFNRYEQKIENFNLSEIYSPPPEIFQEFLTGSFKDVKEKLSEAQKLMDQLEQRIHIEGNHIIKAASFYEGQIKGLLNELKSTIDDYEKIKDGKSKWDIDDKDSEKLTKLESKINNLVEELIGVVTKTEEWIQALSSDLGRAKEKYRSFRFEYAITPQKVRHDIMRFKTPEEKIHYLGLFLKPKARKVLSQSVIKEVKRLVGQIAKANDLYKVAAEMYEEQGLKEEAKTYWIKEGDDKIKKSGVGKYPGFGYYKDCDPGAEIAYHAANAYEKAEEWKKAAKAWCRAYSEELALRNYSRAGIEGFERVGIYFMKMGRKAKKHRLRIESSFYKTAANVFAKGKLYEYEGDAWMEAVLNPVGGSPMRIYDVKKDLVKAINAYQKANVPKKLKKARMELEKLKTDIGSFEINSRRVAASLPRNDYLA